MLATAIILSGSVIPSNSVFSEESTSSSAIRFGATHVVEAREQELSLVLTSAPSDLAEAESIDLTVPVEKVHPQLQLAAQPKSLLGGSPVPAPAAEEVAKPNAPERAPHPQAMPMRTDRSNPVVAHASNRLMNYQPLPQYGAPQSLPMRPSGIGATLSYLQCDPYTCPGIWDGLEAQRARELARKCHLYGSCGVSCGQSCSSCAPAVPHCGKFNRYRQGCSGCELARVQALTLDAMNRSARYQEMLLIRP